MAVVTGEVPGDTYLGGVSNEEGYIDVYSTAGVASIEAYLNNKETNSADIVLCINMSDEDIDRMMSILAEARRRGKEE